MRLILALSAAAACLGLAGCQQVPFNERQHVQSRLMEVDSSPSHVHFRQKIFYSREGAAGGIGETAGGGCGCY